MSSVILSARFRARAGNDQRAEMRNLFFDCRDRAHQVVATGWDLTETEPRIPCDETLEILRGHDIQFVPVDGGPKEFGIFLHYNGR
jgi:hypothetical protein